MQILYLLFSVSRKILMVSVHTVVVSLGIINSSSKPIFVCNNLMSLIVYAGDSLSPLCKYWSDTVSVALLVLLFWSHSCHSFVSALSWYLHHQLSVPILFGQDYTFLFITDILFLYFTNVFFGCCFSSFSNYCCFYPFIMLSLFLSFQQYCFLSPV